MAPLPLSTQAVLLKVPTPVVAKVTVPLGVVFVPVSVSVTVAVQVVGTPTGTEVGEQLTVVVVERGTAVMSAAPLEPRWLPSPP